MTEYSEGKYQESQGDPLPPQHELKRVDVVKKGRHYQLPSGKLVKSITNGLGILDKPALKWWAAQIERDLVVEKFKEMGGVKDAAMFPLDIQVEELRDRLGTKYAHQMRLKEAGAIGTALHKAIQAHLANAAAGDAEPPTDIEGPALLAYMAWEDWAESVNLEPLLVETMLGSERLNAGGTLDCAGMADIPFESVTHECVFDWKSSKRSKTAPNGIYPEAEIQVSCYREMAVEMKLISQDAWAAVVRLPKNEDDPVLKERAPFDVKWIEPERASRLARLFMSVSDVWDGMKREFP